MTSPCSSPTPPSSTSAPRPAACGRPPTTAPPGTCCSTTRTTPSRSATSRLPPTMPTSSGSAPARTTTARAARGATASTSPPTAARRGRTWGCATRSTSRASSSTRSITTWSTSPRSAACGARARSAASSRPPTAGSTWTKVLYVDADTGATELVQDPSNNKVIYAATYQRRRAGFGFNGGGPGSGIHKSSDAGRTWTKLTNGIPPGHLGRIGMDIYRKNPNILYAVIQHADRKRHLPLRRCRAVVAQDVERQPAADVLQPDPRRPDQRPARLCRRRPAAHLRRRRQDLHRERHAALGSSRVVDQSGQPESHHRRQRRRDRHELGQGQDRGRASTT